MISIKEQYITFLGWRNLFRYRTSLTGSLLYYLQYQSGYFACNNFHHQLYRLNLFLITNAFCRFHWHDKNEQKYGETLGGRSVLKKLNDKTYNEGKKKSVEKKNPQKPLSSDEELWKKLNESNKMIEIPEKVLKRQTHQNRAQ